MNAFSRIISSIELFDIFICFKLVQFPNASSYISTNKEGIKMRCIVEFSNAFLSF